MLPFFKSCMLNSLIPAFSSVALISAALNLEAFADKIEADGHSFEFSVSMPKGVSEKGVAVLVHGFGRSPKHMQPEAKRLQEMGFITVLPSMTLGLGVKSETGAVFAKAFSKLSENPNYAKLVSLPKIVLGHSAGAIWATRFAAERASLGDTIRGIVLIDPVVRADQQKGFVEALQPLKKLALFAPPSQCNAKNEAKKHVTTMPESFLGLHLKQGSHCDIEAESTDFLCTTICGKSSSVVVQRVGNIVSEWTNSMFESNETNTYLPGGEEFEALVSSGEATPF
jgi:hypothetical protein